MMRLLPILYIIQSNVDHRMLLLVFRYQTFCHHPRSNVKPPAPHNIASPYSYCRTGRESERAEQRKNGGNISELFYYSLRFIGNYLSLVHWHWKINPSVYGTCSIYSYVWNPARENAARENNAKKCNDTMPNWSDYKLLDVIALLAGSPRWNISVNHCHQLAASANFFFHHRLPANMRDVLLD